jgi:hypothetical protein
VPPIQVVPGTVTVVRDNARAYTFECQKYKTKNNNYCWSYGYQIGAGCTSSTYKKRKEGHNPAATKENIIGGDTWGVEIL